AGLGRTAGPRAELPGRVEADGAQVVGNRHLAAGIDRFAVEDGDRQRAFDLGALQARAGDLDAVEGGGVAGSAFLVLVLRERSTGPGEAGGARDERQCDRVAELVGLQDHLGFSPVVPVRISPLSRGCATGSTEITNP